MVRGHFQLVKSWQLLIPYVGYEAIGSRFLGECRLG